MKIHEYQGKEILRRVGVATRRNVVAVSRREGRRHSIFQRGPFKTMVPRHNDVVDELARKICKDLEIPWVK